jgi:hypothetical protein
LEGKDTENETKNAQKQPQTKNFSGKKLFASVGIILVFTLNIFTWFQPTFAAFKPVEGRSLLLCAIKQLISQK